jgi:hypothetical protein
MQGRRSGGRVLETPTRRRVDAYRGGERAARPQLRTVPPYPEGAVEGDSEAFDRFVSAHQSGLRARAVVDLGVDLGVGVGVPGETKNTSSRTMTTLAQ